MSDAEMARIDGLGQTIEAEVESARSSSLLAAEARSDLQKLKGQILTDTAWHRSRGALAVGVMAGVVNATANLLLDLVPKHPGWVAIKPLYQTVEQALKDWDFDPVKIRQVLVTAALIDRMNMGSEVREVATALLHFALALKEAVNDKPAEQRELQREVRQMVETIDAHLARYELGIRAGPGRIQGVEWELNHQRTECLDYQRLYRRFMKELGF